MDLVYTEYIEKGYVIMAKQIYKRGICIVMSAALLIFGLTASAVSDGAKKASVKSKNIQLNIGEKKSIKIKNKKKKAKYKYVSSRKRIASVSKKGVITGKREGKATITVKEAVKKKFKNIGKVNVTVAKRNLPKETKQPESTSVVQPTSAPLGNDTVPTQTPDATPEPTKAPTREPLVLTDTGMPGDANSFKSDTAYGKMERKTYYSTTVGKDRSMNVITPPGYNEDEKYPVLYMCHGGNGDEGDWLSGNPNYMLGNLIAEGEAKPMIMVLVNCRARMNDGANPSDSLSHDHMDAWTNFLFELQTDIMPYMEDNYSILTGRENTGICGLSMGGRESLYIGFKIPEKIGYIGAFSPAFGIFEYENWGLHEDGYFTEEEFTLPEQYMDTTTCMIMNGANDSMVRDEPERYHKALIKNGVNHYYYTIPGDHNMDVWKNGLYHFLKIAFK